MLKKDVSSNKEKTKICVFFNNITDKLLVGKNPPEEIIVIARFNELKVLILNNFKIIKIKKVISEYNKKILKDCFKVSDLLNDI